MVGQIWDALVAWQDDPAVELVLLDGAGDRALCAGGDVRSLYDSRTQGSGACPRVLERRVPAQRADRPLSQALRRHPGRHRHGRRHRPLRPCAPPHRHGALAARHAGDRHRPDPRCRRHLAAGACAGRDRHLPGPDRREHERGRRHPRALRGRVRALGQARARSSSGSCDPKGGERRATPSPSTAQEPGPSQLARSSADIDQAFAGATRRGHSGRAGETPGEWAAKTAAALAQKSPKALKLTLAAIRNARTLARSRQALNVEYRLTVRLFEDGEFPEGVRALHCRQGPQAQVVAARSSMA